MRWTQVNNCWECVFVNVPFLVRYHPDERMDLFFCKGDKEHLLHCGSSKSIETAKLEVESFVLDHLAQYSAIVHRECLEATVMTWRKLKEQLDQIPEDQLDEAINHLDTDGYWVGEPRIELADNDLYMESADCKDCSDWEPIGEDQELVVEKGKYFLSTCQV